MISSIRRTLRRSLSLVLVTLPASYLLWQWRYEEHQVLSQLSYENFDKHLSENAPGAFWTYFLYTLLAFLCIYGATAILAAGIGRVFPDNSVRLPEKRD